MFFDAFPSFLFTCFSLSIQICLRAKICMNYEYYNNDILYTLITFIFLPQDLPDSIQVGGRISPQTVWDYVEKIKASGTKVRKISLSWRKRIIEG